MRVKRVLISLLFITFISTSIFSKTVKVGYFIDAGNFMSGSSEKDMKSGYAYEYLQTISSYTGWTYEYKYGNWSELYQALQTGEIDILADVSYTKEREKLFLYPDYKMGTENYYIYAAGYNKDFVFGDINLLNGKNIGVDKDSYQYDLFIDLIKKNNISCDMTVYTQNESKSELDFNAGKFDYYLSVDILANFFWEPVLKVGQSDFYLAVTKARQDLLNELNDALSQLYMVNPFFDSSLWQKYFSDITTSKSLTPVEEEWINNHKGKLIIGYLDDDLPFAGLSENECVGLLSGLFENLSYVLDADSVAIQYISYQNYEELVKDLKNNIIDIGFPFYKDSAYSENYGLINSMEVTAVPFGYICHKKKNVYDFLTAGVIPFSRNNYITEKYFPNYEQVIYSSEDEILNAISKRKLDCALFDMYKIQNLLYNQKKAKKLKFVSIPLNYDICFSLIPDNYPVCTIINKMLASIPKSEINLLIEQNTIQNKQYSFQNFLKDYATVIVSVFALITFLVFALIFTLKKLLEYINYDPLTHMLNRRRLDSYIKKFVHRANDKRKPFSIVLFDLDNFKKINDTYGHDCGDMVLVSIASIIRDNIRSRDYAFRWGGEEFLMLLNCGSKDSIAIAERIRIQIENSTLNYNNFDIKMTVTAGCVEYEKGMPYSKMFISADEKLYKGKTSGKNVVIY